MGSKSTNFITLSRFSTSIIKKTNISRTAQTLYATDAENAKLMESITERNVVDLSSQAFDASSLRTRDIFCYHHGAIQEEKNFLCALTVGKNIKRWILQKKKYSL